MKSDPIPPGWNAALRRFPPAARAILSRLPAQRGVVTPAQTARLLRVCGADGLDGLMTALLPLAACYAVTPISDFRVGAVAAGGGRVPALYFGANLELGGGALGYSVHAEQSAINHAWLAGERSVARLAVTAPPCGHCRQFIRELSSADTICLLLPGRAPLALGDLLPEAFGPDDLGISARLLRPARHRVRRPGTDPLARAAHAAAVSSHAPHSGTPAGCALLLDDGAIVSGRSAENAAYNPTLPALASALSALVFQTGPGSFGRITRAVLVEGSGRGSQQTQTAAMLVHCAPQAQFDYFAGR